MRREPLVPAGAPLLRPIRATLGSPRRKGNIMHRKEPQLGSAAPNRRDVLLAGTAVAAASTLGSDARIQTAQAPPQQRPSASSGQPPNIVYFLVDNLGFGELGCYGGGIL